MSLLKFAVGALALASTVSVQAKCQIQFMEMPVRMEGSRAIATLGINGTKIPLLVDTGAFFSILTRASTEELGLKLEHLPFGFSVDGIAGKMVDPRMTTVDHLQLLSGEIPDIEFVVGGNDSGLGGMGLLGRNILAVFDTEYDLAHGVIRFVIPNEDCEKSNMAYWARDMPVSELPLIRDRDGDRRDKTPAIRALVKVNGHETLALFDTGATTLVSLHAAKRAGLQDTDLQPIGDLHGVGKGRVKDWAADFDSVELGGETVTHNHLDVSDFEARDFDMLLGIDFFLSHHIYISKKRSRMFFTYNGGPVFARNVGEKTEAAASAPATAAEALSADDLFRRGSASLARKDYVAALADLDRACALEPGNAAFHATRAVVHQQLKDFPKALADLDTALTLDPKLADARMQRAYMLPRNTDHARSLEDLAFLDDTLPPLSNLRANMARLYNVLGSPVQAIKQWTLWIDNHPNDVMVPSAQNSRCWARVQADIELDRARKDCDAAIDDDSKNPHFLDTRGWLSLRLDQPAKARADFDAAIRTQPTDVWPLYGRALVHMRLGETAEAQADLAAARKAEPKIDERVKAAGFEPAP